jgi:hypothetical protein
MQKIKIIVAVFIALLALGIFHQAFVVVPREEAEARMREVKLKIQAEEQREIDRKLGYSRCVDSAYYMYSGDWDAQCGLLGKGDGCTLARYQTEKIEQNHKEAKDRCVTLWK